MTSEPENSLDALTQDRKSFCVSLIYLRAEAKRMGEAEIEKILQETISTVLKHFKNNKEIYDELQLISTFVGRALLLSKKDLISVVALLELLEEDDKPPLVEKLLSSKSRRGKKQILEKKTG